MISQISHWFQQMGCLLWFLWRQTTTWPRAGTPLSLRLDQRWLLSHLRRVTHTWVGKLPIVGSDNGLSPSRRQANARIKLFGPLGTHFSEILIAIDKFAFKKMLLKISSGTWRPFCHDLSVLIQTKRPSLWWHLLQARSTKPHHGKGQRTSY